MNRAESAIGSTLDAISKIVPRPDKEFSGKDGLLHCAECLQPVQVKIQFAGETKTVRCICDCIKKRMDEAERIAKLADHERNRKRCFPASNMAAWTFEHDDRTNAKLSDAMTRYAENFQQFRKSGKGLLLFGNVGTGKTYYAACIANRLIDNGYTVLMTNFSRLANQIQGLYDGKQEFIDSLNYYDLLILDDLGAERKSEYMQEMVFNIIDSRYRAGMPFIVTTNLTANEIKKPQDVGNSRIYDRVLERCFPVEVTGASRRRAELRETYSDMKLFLGL